LRERNKEDNFILISYNIMKIYFAAPLFSIAERKYNEILTEKLEKSSFDVFLPQRD